MGQWKPVPLPDGSYADASRPFSDQDVVNYWTEYPSGQGTRSNHKLVQLPGLRPYLDLGAGPHRGARNVEGVLYLVADTHAYRVDTDGEVTQLGVVPGRGRVWINHNQNDSGAVRQVMFSTGPEGWIWDVAAETYTQISDDAFHGARSLIYLNSRFLGIEQQRRYFANSALADGLEWDSTETYQAESSPDRLVALVAYAGEVLAFNGGTLEFFQNTTNPTDIANHIYFTRVGPPVQIGAASPHGVSVLDNRVFFVGSDGAGYYMSGYTPTRITTPAIDTAWSQCDISKCFAFTYVSRGHAVWYVTFPDGHTWGYDCLTQKWHRRQTIGLDRWRLNTLVAWNGDYYGGAYNSGVLYKVDWTYEGLEGCDEIVREFTTGVLHDEGNRVTVDGIRIECDTGYGTTTCESVDPQVFDQITVAVVQGGQGFLLAEFSPSDLTTEVIASKLDLDDLYYQSRPFLLGDHLAVVFQVNVTEDNAGVAIYSRSGSAFTLVDSLDNSGTQYMLGAEKLSDTRFIVLWQEPNTLKQTAQLCEWDGAAITVVDEVTDLTETHGTPDYLCSCVCEGKAVFYLHGELDDRFLICTVTGDSLAVTYSSTFGNTVGGQGLAAIGDKIATGKGRIYSFSGTDMTEVQATASSGVCMTTDDTRFVSMGFDASSYWRLADSPYTKTAHATQYEAASGGGGGSGLVFVPGDDQSFGANEHGVLQFSSGAFTEIAPFAFDEFDEGDISNLLATVVKVPE